jgi:hypothetical protein
MLIRMVSCWTVLTAATCAFLAAFCTEGGGLLPSATCGGSKETAVPAVCADAAKGRNAPRPLIKSAALALLAPGEMKPGGMLELSEETEGTTEEDPCCVSALLD